MVIMSPLIPNVQGKGDPGFSSGSGGSSPPAEWLPTDISGCVLWLPPDLSYMEIADVGDPGPPTVDGDAVGRWIDASGGGNDATQGTAANRPLYYSAVQNSLPMVRFDGSNDCLSLNGMAGTFSGEDTAFTVAIVVKKITNTSNDGWFSASVAATTPYFMIYNNPSQYIARKYDGTTDRAPGYVVADDLSPYVFLIRVNGTTVDLWRNSTQGITAGNLNVNSITFDRVTIGGRFNSGSAVLSDPGNLNIGEIIIWNNAISNTDATTVRTELIAKWGL